MKQKFPRFRRRSAKEEKPTAKSLFTQLAAIFYHLPELEIRGGLLITEGCRRVLEFSDSTITLDMGDTLLTFYGKRLRIESFCGKRIVVAGKPQSIAFKPKWEAEDE